MSKIKATFNKDTSTWFHQRISLMPLPTTLEFYFISQEEVTKFTYLEYGFQLMHNHQIVAEETLSLSTGQKEIYYTNSCQHEAPLLIEPLKNYQLNTWIKLDPNSKIESILEFLSPTEPQPYPSWTYVSGKWEPPVPNPDEGKMSWDETSKSWVSIAHLYRMPT